MTAVASDPTLLRVPTQADCRPILRPAGATRSRLHPVVGVVGLGYVGLPTALALLEAGSRVIGVDVSAARRQAIAGVDVDLLERDRERLRRHVGGDRFAVTGDAAALHDAEVVLVCVPTPVDESLAPDLRALRAATATVVAHARRGQLIVLTSTSYVGTTRELLVEPLAARGLVAGVDVSVAFSPERIDPGNVQFPVENTPRVVGGASPGCTERAASFLARTAPSVHQVSSCEAAEMSKLHENTFRAVNIAYANEIADVCEELGLDPMEVIDAAATKPYGFMKFRPGPGVGGHCIPCDPHYLLWQLRRQRAEAPLIDTTMKAIAARPGRLVRRVKDTLADAGRSLRGARVLIVGVSYKPGVADLRESPALEMMAELIAAGAHVGYHDALIPSLVIEGSVLSSVPSIEVGEWDVALLHTMHPGTDLGGLLGGVPVVDATYSAATGPDRS